jgi:SMODS and SLOG-associating 2TM effector domain 3/SMODS and SLOG-associating 2TM effector domain 1
MSAPSPGRGTDTAGSALDDLNDEGLPSAYRAADRTAIDGQRKALHLNAWKLVLLLVAAACGAASWTLAGSRIDLLALLAALAFGLSLVVEVWLLSQRPDRRWYKGRAGAESVKTLAWRYAVGGEPFTSGDPAADDEFLAQVGDVMRSLKGIEWLPASGGHDQITPAMRRLRSATLEDRRRAYERNRIDDQSKWYRAKAAANDRQARRWSALALAGTIAGLIGALLRAIGLVDVDLLGVASAWVAAVTAWTQLHQHRSLATAYTITAEELGLVKARTQRAADEDSWAQIVSEAEAAISREHTLWQARRVVED